MTLSIEPLDAARASDLDALLVSAMQPQAVSYTAAPGFVEHRVLGSSLVATDCSRIAVDADRLVGCAIANLRRFPGEPDGERAALNFIGVLPEYRRRGLGRRLLEAAVAECRQSYRGRLVSSMRWAGIWPGVLVGSEGARALRRYRWRDPRARRGVPGGRARWLAAAGKPAPGFRSADPALSPRRSRRLGAPRCFGFRKTFSAFDVEHGLAQYRPGLDQV